MPNTNQQSAFKLNVYFGTVSIIQKKVQNVVYVMGFRLRVYCIDDYSSILRDVSVVRGDISAPQNKKLLAIFIILTELAPKT